MSGQRRCRCNGHALKRLYKRYGIMTDMAEEVVRVFYNTIDHHGAVWREPTVLLGTTHHRERLAYATCWHGQWLVPVYDVAYDTLVTFLDLDMQFQGTPSVACCRAVTYAELTAIITGEPIEVITNTGSIEPTRLLVHACQRGHRLEAACDVSGTPCTECGGTYQVKG